MPGGQYGCGVAFSWPWAFVGDLADCKFGVFRQLPTGWTFQDSDRGPLSSYFGNNIATDGETAVVGGYKYKEGSPPEYRGMARVYELVDGRWEVLQDIAAPPALNDNVDGNHLFGSAVAVDGDVMVIGAGGYKVPHHWSGLVLIYEKRQGTWEIETSFGLETLDGPNGWHGSLGAGGVDIAGDVIAVAAPAFEGGVYILERDSGGWQRTAFLYEPNPPDEGEHFGDSLALSEDGRTLVVGQQSPDSSTYPFVYVPGRAHVFEREDSGVWPRTAELHASDEHFRSDSSTGFGISVDIEGDSIVVGARHSKGDPGIPGDEGAVYHYRRRPDGTWPTTEDGRWWTEDPAAYRVGRRVALDKGFVIAGNHSNDPAHVFEITTGETFCPSAVNSTGKHGVLSAVGSPLLVENTFTLSARSCPAYRPGVFILSLGQTPPQIAGDGLLCLAPPVLRLPSPVGTGPTGAALLSLDLTDPSLSAILGPGTTVHFQFGFLDSVGAGANLTNGVSVTFE